jgi:hypothetical protein
MRRLPPAALGVLVIAAAAAAEEVILGEMGFPLNVPFCGT